MAPEPRKRIRALDGLRGLAALVVVVHHSMLASSAKLAVLYNSPGAALQPARGSFNWLIFYTPLHIFWAGPEFVAVFFVLSGFVLALPAVKSRWLKVISYYPSRLLRLYLPVWAALVFALVLHVIVTHHAIPGGSWWLNGHSASLSWNALFQGMIMGPGAGNFALNTALWTMYWIVLFTLLLPVLLVLPFRWRIIRLSVAAVCFYVMYHGTTPWSIELPPFVLGVVLAFEQKSLARLAKRWEQAGSEYLLKTLLAVAVVALLTADRWLAYRDRKSVV